MCGAFASRLKGAAPGILPRTAETSGLFTARARKEPKGRPFLIQYIRRMLDFKCAAEFHSRFGCPLTINVGHLVRQELQERQHLIAAIGHDALIETLQGKIYNGWHLVGRCPVESAKSVGTTVAEPSVR